MRHERRTCRKRTKARARRARYEQHRNNLRNAGDGSHRRQWQPLYGANVIRALGGHIMLSTLLGRGR